MKPRDFTDFHEIKDEIEPQRALNALNLFFVSSVFSVVNFLSLCSSVLICGLKKNII